MFFLSDSNDNISLPQLTSNTVPFFTIAGGEQSVEIHNPYFNALGTVSKAIHVISSPTNPVLIDGISTAGTITELTDSVKDVSTPGCMARTTLASGSGTLSAACITTGSIPTLVDLTNSGNTCSVGTLANGSLTITGTGTDVCKGVFQ